jgi:hypothetical protein
VLLLEASDNSLVETLHAINQHKDDKQPFYLIFSAFMMKYPRHNYPYIWAYSSFLKKSCFFISWQFYIRFLM